MNFIFGWIVEATILFGLLFVRPTIVLYGWGVYHNEDDIYFNAFLAFVQDQGEVDYLRRICHAPNESNERETHFLQVFLHLSLRARVKSILIYWLNLSFLIEYLIQWVFTRKLLKIWCPLSFPSLLVFSSSRTLRRQPLSLKSHCAHLGSVYFSSLIHAAPVVKPLTITLTVPLLFWEELGFFSLSGHETPFALCYRFLEQIPLDQAFSIML